MKKILIAGCGAIGSNLVRNLVPDLRGEHEITILDMDLVEERNVTPGTQWYSLDQVGIPKVDALQFNIFKWYEREIEIVNEEYKKGIALPWFDLIVDCFDNHRSRLVLQETWLKVSGFDLLHIGFSDQFTFSIEWADGYQVPTDITSGMDICEMPGAAAFVSCVSSLGALSIERYLDKGEKMQMIGGKYSHSIVR